MEQMLGQFIAIVFSGGGAIVVGVLGSLIAGFLLGQRLDLPFLQHRHLRRILSFPKNGPIVIVVAHREQMLATDALPRIALETVFALNNIQSILGKLGWRGEVKILEVNRVGDTDKQGNLIILGGDRVNSLTRDFLTDLASKERDTLGFERTTVKTEERWHIRSENATFVSKSYEQLSSNASNLEDVALITRISNPRNEKKAIVILAGIRGIGTWGAADFLDSHARDLSMKLRAAHMIRFQALISVSYRREGLGINETRLGFVKQLP